VSLTVRIDEPAPVNQLPQAAIAGPATGAVTETLHFDGSGSFDPDGTIVDYAWDFGDGNNASGDKVNHVYNAAGNYTIRLTVTDNNGAEANTTLIIQITEAVEVGS
jgi:PKD repeat protein